MSKEMREQINKIKNFGQFLNENNSSLLYVDEHGKNIVYDDGTLLISVDDINDAKYIALWDMNKEGRKKVGFLIFSSIRFYNGGEYRKLDSVEIDDKYRGQGYGLKLYQYGLKYLRNNIKGFFSYLPDVINKKQVPSIYKRLNVIKSDSDDYVYVNR